MVARMLATIPTVSDVRAPYRSRLSSSRPSLSVPSGNLAVGPSGSPALVRPSPRNWKFGSNGARIGARIAAPTIRVTPMAPIQNAGFARR